MILKPHKKCTLFWYGIGLGAIIMIGVMIFLQVTNIKKHIPIYYGTEPYAQDPASGEICRPSKSAQKLD